MAEGLALAASVIAVIQITNSAISVCYDYSSAVKGTSWEIPRLRSELESLRTVLQQLEPLAKQAEIAQTMPDTNLPAFAQLCTPGGPLQLCFQDIEKLEEVLKTPSWSDGFGPKRRAIVQVLRWPLKEKETEKALRDIRRFTDVLSFALNADQLALSLEIQRVFNLTNDAVVESQQMLNNIQRMTLNVRDGIDSTKDVALKVNDQVESLRLDSRRKAIRRWLSAPDPSTNYQRGCRSRHEMTGTWFTQSEAFERWKMDENTILWLHGKPGCGKTVLCSTIITDILCQCEASSQSSVAYFFFDFNSSEKQMSSQMVRSIMTQLPGRSINALAQVESLFASCSEGQRQPDNEGLMEILQANMQEYSHTFVILDALDECSDLEELLTLISEIESWKLPTLHLLFTSRRLTTIEETLRGLTKSTNMIEIQSKLVDMDISNYVSERLRVDKRLQRWNKRPDIKEEIRSTLATKADGMFRWAVCQLDSLQKCPNIPSLRQTLRSLPKTLDDTYARILCNIPEEYSDYALTILRWLTYALEPMRLNELGEVFAVNILGDPWFDPDARFPDPSNLLEICSCLVQVDEFDKRTQHSIVRLAHLSVKEYLLSERIRTQKPEKYALLENQSHESIAATCLAYLLQFDSTTGSESINFDSKDSPLLNYAIKWWVTHARVASPHLGAIERPAMAFLRRDSVPYTIWFRAQADLGGINNVADAIPPLHAMASCGVFGVVQSLLKQGANVNQLCSIGTALWAASANGRGAVVKLLLENGADPNYGHENEARPLSAAAMVGDLDIVKALVDTGAIINQEGGYFGNALIGACASRRIDSNTSYEIAHYLMEKGADVHMISKAHGTALQAACAKPRARLGLVRELVARGAKIDAQGGNYGTPLQAACAHHGNDDLIRFLLSKADPRTEVYKSKYGTALQAVCAESHDNVEMVKLLLQHGAFRNARGGKYGTALQAACSRNNIKIVRLLLQKQGPPGENPPAEETDINIEGGKYGSALHAACREDHEDIATLLLECGAQINANVGKFGTPLHVACARHSTSIIKLLVEKGADVNIRGGRYGTVTKALFSTKFRDEDMDIVRLLSERGTKESSISPPEVKGLEV